MTVEIEDLEPASDEAWDDFWEDCPHATYFHSREWAEIWARDPDDDLAPDPRLVTFSDGVEVLLPFSRRRRLRGLSDVLVSSPAGTYGGWLLRDPEDLTRGHVEALAGHLEGRNATFKSSPFDPTVRDHGDAIPWTDDDFTQAVEYADGIDAIREALDENGVLRKEEQAEDAGLELERTTDRDVLDDYWDIYQACREDWGEEASNDYDRRIFEAFDLESPFVDMWVIRDVAGTVVGGGPFVKKPSFHVDSWLTLAYPDRLDLNPYDFLYGRLIDHYHDEGYDWFDFNPSSGHEGVVQFKSKFGTKRLPTRRFAAETLTLKLLGKIDEVL